MESTASNLLDLFVNVRNGDGLYESIKVTTLDEFLREEKLLSANESDF